MASPLEATSLVAGLGKHKQLPVPPGKSLPPELRHQNLRQALPLTGRVHRHGFDDIALQPTAGQNPPILTQAHRSLHPVVGTKALLLQKAGNGLRLSALAGSLPKNLHCQSSPFCSSLQYTGFFRPCNRKSKNIC
ncbi:MAG: hypothetical protein BHW33_00895 [Firmicutes bacterium CAG:137_57_8]|nr:MAG: hypothetical protein BHW33_00895 [Firmicutes bacterium CAG:137_57_8]